MQRFYREIDEERRNSEKIPANMKEFKDKFREFYTYIYDTYKEGTILQNEQNKKKEENEKSEMEEKKTKLDEPDLLRKKSATIEIKRKNPKDYKFFINFLKTNGNIAYYTFLRWLNKDTKIYDILKIEVFEKYSIFFEPESDYFLHLDAETISKFYKINRTVHGAKTHICKHNKYTK